MEYSFKEKTWKNDFDYAYSLAARSFRQFTEGEDHIRNGFNDVIAGYDYISAVYKDTVTEGVFFSAVCSFEGSGAPILTLADNLWRDGEGHLRYGDHYEVVAYKGGCNVWHVMKAPEGSAAKHHSELCVALAFELPENTPIEMSLKVTRFYGVRVMKVRLWDKCFQVPIPLLGERFYLGVTACEGLTRLYGVTIEE